MEKRIKIGKKKGTFSLSHLVSSAIRACCVATLPFPPRPRAELPFDADPRGRSFRCQRLSLEMD